MKMNERPMLSLLLVDLAYIYIYIYELGFLMIRLGETLVEDFQLAI